MEQQNNPAEGKRGKTWTPFLWIIAASALAHLWCLGSQFYMDDIMIIRDNDAVRTGRFAEMGLSVWTYLWYTIQYRLFGMSPAGFHAVNWILHTGVACVLFGFGRDFLREKWPAGVALFGALLFAVHPLASEIPNYARTQDLAWVTLFSLLAAWALLRFLRDGGGWKLAGCGIFIVAATYSKGPGLFHALMMAGAVGLAFLQPRHWSVVRRHRWPVAGIFLLGLGVLWQLGNVGNRLQVIHDPRFLGHGYTLSRVFWEFAWRSVIPVALSSDHHIAETLVPAGASFWNIPDTGAMVAAAAFLGLAALSGVLAWRKPTRLFGVCLFLFVGSILFRIFYVIPEFMPEYRIYPGLPWFCLGAAILLAAVWKYLFETLSPRLPAAILLGIFILLSAKRAFLWHDLDRLMADVLKQYPAQARAIWELDDRDLAAGNWQAVIDRQEQVWPEVRRKFIASLTELAPARELPSGHFSMAEVACMGRYANAVAHEKSPAAGLRLIDELEAYMRALRIDPATNPNHWNLFARDKALVLETAGNYQAALDCLKRKDLPPAWPRDFERISRKLAEIKPGS